MRASPARGASAARLCAAAKEGELVCDADTLVAAGWPVTAAETIVVKGKQAPLSVGRFTVETALRHAGQH